MYDSIFVSIYNICCNAIFGMDIITAYDDATAHFFCSFVAVSACLFVMALPFIIVWKVIKMICG